MYDYTNAAKLFGTDSNFARAPKYKVLFFVRFILNVGDNTELSYAVKTAELPKFEIDVQDVNQYNKKVIVQRQVKYTPVTIKFHDDNYGTLRDFWQQYYQYYFDDGVHDDNDYKPSDLYEDSRTNSNWGFSGKNQDAYIKSIEIYSMNAGKAQKVILESPTISSFTHDTHDHSEGTGMMEASMTVHYTGVKYEFEVSAGDIPGFFAAYDTSDPSGLGNATEGAATEGTSSLTDNTTDYSLATQQAEYNSNQNLNTPMITDQQIGSIGTNTFLSPSNPYSFPVINNDTVINTDFGSTEVLGNPAVSNNVLIQSPEELGTNYPVVSWQAGLSNKGYSLDQIYAAESYIRDSGVDSFGRNPNWQNIAEMYIQNPRSGRLPVRSTFGQTRTNSTKIDFTNPAMPVQPVYQGLGWQQNLINLGYTTAEISLALKFMANLKVAPGTDLTNIAINYINSIKEKGIVTSSIKTKIKTSKKDTKLIGPNFNSTTSSSINSSYNKI